jgi:hypothetical protein
VRWDEDLLRNSTGKNQVGEPLETMVKVSSEIPLLTSRHRFTEHLPDDEQVGERIGEWTS